MDKQNSEQYGHDNTAIQFSSDIKKELAASVPTQLLVIYPSTDLARMPNLLRIKSLEDLYDNVIAILALRRRVDHGVETLDWVMRTLIDAFFDGTSYPKLPTREKPPAYEDIRSMTPISTPPVEPSNSRGESSGTSDQANKPRGDPPARRQGGGMRTLKNGTVLLGVEGAVFRGFIPSSKARKRKAGAPSPDKIQIILDFGDEKPEPATVDIEVGVRLPDISDLSTLQIGQNDHDDNGEGHFDASNRKRCQSGPLASSSPATKKYKQHDA
ncbi:hypothetical protein F4802DRAFT_580567 [Xylaria palmicola]|nr:hypothetical protein F4802DRAFT_580567 [Xylaria palmicola]